jgi:hypothetical protein
MPEEVYAGMEVEVAGYWESSFRNFSLFAERAVLPLDVLMIHLSSTTLT